MRAISFLVQSEHIQFLMYFQIEKRNFVDLIEAYVGGTTSKADVVFSPGPISIDCRKWFDAKVEPWSHNCVPRAQSLVFTRFKFLVRVKAQAFAT